MSLAFSLDYYTDAQDLNYMADYLHETQPRVARMYEVLGDIVQEYGLVSFETLAVEEKASMIHLVEVLDRAIGYVARDSA